jgi:hypothetical protein
MTLSTFTEQSVRIFKATELRASLKEAEVIRSRRATRDYYYKLELA